MSQDKKKYSPKIQYIKYNPNVENYETIFDKKTKKESKKEDFKIRLNEFKNVLTLKDAKDLLSKTIPVVLDRTTFFIDDAKCIIINTEKQLRICFDSPEEFISYDFV